MALIETAIADEYISPKAKLYMLRCKVQELPTIDESICSDADTISRRAAIEWCIEGLNNMPSAGPEIIRCKDCKHSVDYYHEGDCYCSNPKWGLKYFGGSWEFYCADAERRTDE